MKADNAGALIWAALLFGILNTILKPFIRLLTLPLAVITLGLIWFGVAMLMLWLTAVLIDGFRSTASDARLGDHHRLGRERRARLRARALARDAPRLSAIKYLQIAQFFLFGLRLRGYPNTQATRLLGLEEVGLWRPSTSGRSRRRRIST